MSLARALVDDSRTLPLGQVVGGVQHFRNLTRSDSYISRTLAVYASGVNTHVQLLVCFLFFQVTSQPRERREFLWDRHQSQSLFSAPSLKDANIAASEKAELIKVIENRVGPPDPRDPQMASEDQVRHAVLNANIRMVRLNQDEKEPFEVVVQIQHLCSPDGNCWLWFFRKSPHGYKLLLDTIGQGFTLQKTSADGFSDLVVSMHSSATDQSLKVYRYARGRYWRVACYDVDWAPLERGVIHQLKEPRITPSSCN